MKGERIAVKDPQLVKELLEKEEDWGIWRKLAFLNAIANLKLPFEQATQIFLLPHPTAYEWIRKWNSAGYEGVASKEGSKRGRPSKLTPEELKKLEELLKRKEFWQTQEVVRLILEEFRVKLSEHQVRRILKHKLRLNFAKPYPKDYRRPDNAEESLKEQLELTYKYLIEAKGYRFEEIAIGFADESSPQLTANTVRVWSSGKVGVRKNTQKMRANTMGFYPLRGEAVWEFAIDSKIERFLDFLEEVRRRNEEYKAVIVVLDNFSTHRSMKVRRRAQEMGIYFVYLPPYSPDLNPIEFIWKAIKRVISVSFVKHVDELKEIIGSSFCRLSQKLSFTKSWAAKFLSRIAFNYGYLCT